MYQTIFETLTQNHFLSVLAKWTDSSFCLCNTSPTKFEIIFSTNLAVADLHMHRFTERNGDVVNLMCHCSLPASSVAQWLKRLVFNLWVTGLNLHWRNIRSNWTLHNAQAIFIPYLISDFLCLGFMLIPPHFLVLHAIVGDWM